MYSLIFFFILGVAGVQCAPGGLIGAPIIAGPAALSIGTVPLGGTVIGVAPLGLGGLGVTRTVLNGPAVIGGLGWNGW